MQASMFPSQIIKLVGDELPSGLLNLHALNSFKHVMEHVVAIPHICRIFFGNRKFKSPVGDVNSQSKSMAQIN